LVSAQAAPAHSFRSFRSPALGGVEMVHAHHRGPLGRWQFVAMTRISCLLSGRVRLWSHGSEELLEPGDTVINCPGSMPRVAGRLTATSETLTVYVAPALCRELARRFDGPAPGELQVHVVRTPRLIDDVRRLAHAIQSGQGEQERLEAMAKGACQAVRAPGVRTMPAGPLRADIARVRQIIEERFDRPICLDELSREVELSKFHLLRLFRLEIGTTPHAYQLHLRVSRARELLDAGVSAAEVALSCGFADQPHFTRSFKRIVGLTPAAFRRIA